MGAAEGPPREEPIMESMTMANALDSAMAQLAALRLEVRNLQVNTGTERGRTSERGPEPRRATLYSERVPEPRRTTMYSLRSMQDLDPLSTKPPKIPPPRRFEGTYSEEYNILNWVLVLIRYLEAHDISEDKFVRYSYNLFSETVQLWYDSAFPEEPEWETLKGALFDRYLPLDHNIRVKLRFERTAQETTLLAYVESFQRILSAISFADIHISEEDRIFQFIRGLRKEEDRKYLLEQNCESMQRVYRAVIQLRQSKTMARYVLGTRRPSPKKKKYNKLQGKEREKAFAEGRCLGCGQVGHYVKDCKNSRVQKAYKAFQKYVGKDHDKNTKYQKKKPYTKKFKNLQTKSTESDPDEEDDKNEILSEGSRSGDETDNSELVISEGGSENSDPESEG
jgi:hypothetical protein